MPQKIAPFLEGKYGWNLGESGWNSGMDENILKFSFLFDRNINDIVDSLPTGANDGDAYFLTTDNRLYFRVSGNWVTSSVPRWFVLVIRTTGELYQFDGSTLVPIESSSDLSDRIEGVELTLSTLGSAAFQNGEYFATQASLDVVEASLSSDIETVSEGVIAAEERFERELFAAGYTFLGNYTADLNITTHKQYFRRGDRFYAANEGTTLPYTTTGDWTGDSAEFKWLGDDVLRQELARSDDPSMGAALIGFSGRSQADRNNDHKSIRDFSGTDTEQFQAAFTLGGAFLVPAGSYEITEAVTGYSDITLMFAGPTVITCTAPAVIAHVLRSSRKLKIIGGPVTIDCDQKSYLAIHAPRYLPECDGVTVKNSLSVAFLCGLLFDGLSDKGYSGSNGFGDGYLRDCAAENCGSFCLARGEGPDSNTSFGLIDCRTDVLTGFITNIFNLADIGYGYVRGGNYRGIPTQAPNMTRTNIAEYIGGRYEGMVRGPTTGESTRYVTMVGGVSINMASFGVSLDARVTSDNSVPYVGGTVDWTCIDCSRSAFIQASGIFLKSINSINPKGDSNADIRLTDSRDVVIGDLISRGAGSKVLLELGAGTAPVLGSTATIVGKLITDSTNSIPCRLTNDNSEVYFGKQKVITDGYVLTWIDETVLVDTAAGIVDIDVPAAASGQEIYGKRWTVKVIDGTNNVTITRSGGGSDAINGGSSYTIPAGTAYREVEIEAIGGGKYIVSVSV